MTVNFTNITMKMFNNLMSGGITEANAQQIATAMTEQLDNITTHPDYSDNQKEHALTYLASRIRNYGPRGLKYHHTGERANEDGALGILLELTEPNSNQRSTAVIVTNMIADFAAENLADYKATR